MKKTLVLLLTILLAFFTCAAYAANIAPLPGISMEDDLNDCTLRIGFKLDALTDREIFADVYTEQRYDAIEVSQLAVGDTITYQGEDIVVETLEVDYSTLINGGSIDCDGVTLCPDEGGTYIALAGEVPAYMLLGCAQLSLADHVIYRHWQQLEDGGIAEDMSETVVPASELKDVLADEGSEAFWPDSLTVTVQDGLVTELNVNYTP